MCYIWERKLDKCQNVPRIIGMAPTTQTHLSFGASIKLTFIPFFVKKSLNQP